MSFLKKLFLVAAVAALMMGSYGCKEKGPAEKAGEKLDKAVEDMQK